MVDCTQDLLISEFDGLPLGHVQYSPNLIIGITCPCNECPLKTHFYSEKLEYTFFLFLIQNIDLGYTLEPPWQGSSNVYPQSFF